MISLRREAIDLRGAPAGTRRETFSARIHDARWASQEAVPSLAASYDIVFLGALSTYRGASSEKPLAEKKWYP